MAMSREEPVFPYEGCNHPAGGQVGWALLLNAHGQYQQYGSRQDEASSEAVGSAMTSGESLRRDISEEAPFVDAVETIE